MKVLLGILVALILSVAGFLASSQSPTPVQGAFNPTGGGTYRIGQSVGTSDTTIRLSSFKEPVSNIPYTMSYLNSDILYGTLSPQSSISEFISATGITQNSDGSATLTGVVRGLSRTPAGSSCIASTTLAQPHAGQSIFILSNTPCFYSEYTPLRTTATSSAVLVFGSTTPPRLDYSAAQSTGTYISTTTEFATINYVNAVAIAGSANATQAVKGIVQLPTARQAASSTALGSTGASNVLTTAIATDTPQNCTITGSLLGGCVVMSQLTGFIRQTWLDLTAQWTFTNLFATNASSSNATTTNTIYYAGSLMQTPKYGGTGTDGALSVSSGTTTINCGTQAVCEKNYTSISITGTGAMNFTSGGTATSTNGLTVYLRSQGACTFTSSALSMLYNQGGGGMGNAHGINGGAVSASNPGGAGGGGVAGAAGDNSKTGSSAGTLGAITIGGVQLPALSSTTRMAYPGGNGSVGMSSGGGGAAGTAGIGGGAFIIECGTTFNFTTGGFSVPGTNGGAGGAGGGNPGGSGGGGGGGGSIYVVYGSLTADTGTYNTAAGSQGAGGTGTNAGDAGTAGAAGGHLEVKNNYWY